MTAIALVGIVSPFLATVRWIAYLRFLAKQGKDDTNLHATAEAVRAYRAGPFGELLDGLSKILKRNG